MRNKTKKITDRTFDYEKITGILTGGGSPSAICRSLRDFHSGQLAASLPHMTTETRRILYKAADAQMLAQMLERCDDAEIFTGEMDLVKAARTMEKIEPDKAADILRALPAGKRKAIIELMGEPKKSSIMMLASYSEDELGSRMTTNFVTVPTGSSVKEAMRLLVAQAADHDNISQIYVTDEKGIYSGAISLKDLIIARDGCDLAGIISTAYPYFYADDRIDECLDYLVDYSEESVPVLSDNNTILGVITSQDIVELVDDELGEDYARLGGLTAEEDLNEPFMTSVKKRLPWLVVLLGLGMVVSGVVGIFEAVVAQLTIIVCFQSLILDMAGNVGTQSLAVTIRVLMDEQLSGKKKLNLLFKEMRVGLTNGMILGVLSFVGIGSYITLFKGLSVIHAFAVSACIGVSLLLAMVISSMVGTVIPMFFKKVGVDPAVASGPLITTINDLVAVVSYYGLTWLFLIGFVKM